MTTTPAARDERELFEAEYPFGVNFERNPHHTEFYFHLPAREKWDAWSKRAALAEAELAEVREQLRIREEERAEQWRLRRDAEGALITSQAVVSELRAELERVKLYASRYKWLRASNLYVGSDDFYASEGGSIEGYANENFDADNLDKYIDAAIDASRDGEGGGV